MPVTVKLDDLLYAKRMTDMIGRYAPDASEAAQLAVRAQHIKRWTVPRDSYAMTKEGYLAWRTGLAHAGPDERCVACLGLRLDAAGAAARELGFARFSTTLTVSPYQRHDIIVAAGETAADRHGVDFIYVDARDRFRTSYAESRRLGLYRQPYCGCAASKWEAWHARRSRRARRA